MTEGRNDDLLKDCQRLPVSKLGLAQQKTVNLNVARSSNALFLGPV